MSCCSFVLSFLYLLDYLNIFIFVCVCKRGRYILFVFLKGAVLLFVFVKRGGTLFVFVKGGGTFDCLLVSGMLFSI